MWVERRRRRKKPLYSFHYNYQMKKPLHSFHYNYQEIYYTSIIWLSTSRTKGYTDKYVHYRRSSTSKTEGRDVKLK